jgi:hypothetical protein
MVIVGAGGVGREALDACLAAGIEVTAFVDERLAGQVVRRLPVLAAGEVAPHEEYVIGIAAPAVRRRLRRRPSSRAAWSSAVPTCPAR